MEITELDNPPASTPTQLLRIRKGISATRTDHNSNNTTDTNKTMGRPGSLEKSEKSKPSTWDTLRTLSVEPAGFLVIISVVVSHLIFQNLMMETICRVDLEYGETACKEIVNKVNASYKAQEREIQQVAAGVQAMTSVIFSSITVLLVLFIGPWSDANGRKVPLLISVAGLVVYSSTLIFCYLIMGKIRALWFSIIAFLPMTLSGGGVVFTMSAYSYISDSTSSKNRTVRTGILSASVRSGTPIGFAVGGVLTRVGVGVIPSLILSVVLAILAFLIVLFGVKNATPAEMRRMVSDKNNGGSSPEDEEQQEDLLETKQTKNKQSKWVRYNPLVKLYQAFSILFKKRDEQLCFWLLIGCHICYASPGQGEYSMLYLFVRERLGWNVSDYGFFSMYNWLMSAAGVVVSMFILSKKLRVPDPVVGFVAGISQIGGSCTYAFASTAVMMYLASGLDMMNGTIGVVVRSMLSKIVEPDEVGKLFALLGVIESLLPLAMVPTYAMLYKNTVTVFAGAFFLLSAAVTLPAEFIFLYFICTNNPKPTDERRREREEVMGDRPLNEQVEGTLDSMNKSVPDMLKLVPIETYSSRDGINQSHNKVINT